ncbi:MAG: hypothetical protein GYA23_12570 [Methanomicrobiales archaeon]|nr:hypothetical protein [Methanomicrobiales archaeon]
MIEPEQPDPLRDLAIFICYLALIATIAVVFIYFVRINPVPQLAIFEAL